MEEAVTGVDANDVEETSVKNLPNILIHQASECEPDTENNEQQNKDVAKQEDSDTGEKNTEHPVVEKIQETVDQEIEHKFSAIQEEELDIEERVDERSRNTNNEVENELPKAFSPDIKQLEDARDKESNEPQHLKENHEENCDQDDIIDSNSDIASDIVENILLYVATALSEEAVDGEEPIIDNNAPTNTEGPGVIEEQNEPIIDAMGSVGTASSTCSAVTLEKTVAIQDIINTEHNTANTSYETEQLSVAENNENDIITPEQSLPPEQSVIEGAATNSENEKDEHTINSDKDMERTMGENTPTENLENTTMEEPVNQIVNKTSDDSKIQEIEIENQLLKAQILDLKDDINRLQEGKESNESEVKDLKLKLRRMIRDGEENTKTINNLKDNLSKMEEKVIAQSKLLDSEPYTGSNGTSVPREKATTSPADKKSSVCVIL